ncbi:MAG: PD-(D/E)XK nuclease family protein [Nitrospinae bacterium]|nr:PD-(D/E)XK nuclease family protein [Nitrospinota bacterium]
MADTLHIYPTRIKAEAEMTRLLALEKAGVLLGTPVMSFQEFESSLEHLLCPGGAADAIARELLLHEAVTADPAFRKRPHLALLTGTEGFIRSLGDLVQQLKLGLVTPDGLDAITGYAPGKEEWIGTVFRRYQRLLDRHGLRDTADVTRMLLQSLAAADALPRPFHALEALHIHDVFHFAPSRFEMLRLIQRLVPVVIHFPLPDDRRKVFDFVERDIQKFQGLEDDAGRIELSFGEPSGENGGPLARFAAALFGEGKPAPIDGLERHAAVIRHAGRYREIEEIAEAILKAKGEGEWSDFCLVFRDIEKYGGIVEDVFRRARIPIYLRRGVPLTDNPHIKTVMAVFTAIETDFARDEVSRLAGSDYFAFLPAGVAAHAADRLLIDAGITGGPSAMGKEKLRHPRHTGMKKTAARFITLVEALEKLARAGRAAQCIEQFEAALELLDPAPLRPDQPFAMRDYHARARLEETLKLLSGAVDHLAMRDAAFTWRDLRRVIAESLGNAAVPTRSSRNDVYVLNVNELPGLTFPHVFICGLHDGEFPRRVLRGAVLGEGEKLAFNRRHAETALEKSPRLRRGRAVFSRLGESWEEESFLFYLGMRAATQSVTFCHSAADLDGAELARSPFLDEITAAFPQLQKPDTPAVALEKDFSAQLDAEAQQAKLLSELFTRGPESAGALKDYYLRFAGDRRFALSCGKSGIELERLAFYGEFDETKRATASNRHTGRLDAAFAPLRRHFDEGVRRTFAPTTLERYAKCPFRYFAEKVLELDPLKLPEPGLERTEAGTLVHLILEKYHGGARAAIPAAAHLDPLGARERRMRIAEDAAFAEYEGKGVKAEPAIWEITREQVRQAMRGYLRREAEIFGEDPYSVLAVEYTFGGDGIPPVTMEGSAPLRLKGSVDRIDYLHNRRMLRIIDYKYSAKITEYKKMLAPENFFERSFQVPIYLYAVMKEFAPSLTPPPAGGFAAYLTLRKDQEMTKHAASVFDACGGETPAALDAAPEFGAKLRALVSRVENGEFSVTPANAQECRSCDFRRLCRYRPVKGAETEDDGNDS